MKVELLYFEGCPHWHQAEATLRDALRALALDGVTIEHRLVTTPEEAVELGFLGSPTILVDGRDPFATPGATPGLTCRLYETPDGPAGSPTIAQLREALGS